MIMCSTQHCLLKPKSYNKMQQFNRHTIYISLSKLKHPERRKQIPRYLTTNHATHTIRTSERAWQLIPETHVIHDCLAYARCATLCQSFQNGCCFTGFFMCFFPFWIPKTCDLPSYMKSACPCIKRTQLSQIFPPDSNDQHCQSQACPSHPIVFTPKRNTSPSRHTTRIPQGSSQQTLCKH